MSDMQTSFVAKLVGLRQVHELANRGVTLNNLLKFWRMLLEKEACQTSGLLQITVKERTLCVSAIHTHTQSFSLDACLHCTHLGILNRKSKSNPERFQVIIRITSWNSSFHFTQGCEKDKRWQKLMSSSWLLRFEVMPSFDPLISTTNDVVRLATLQQPDWPVDRDFTRHALPCIRDTKTKLQWNRESACEDRFASWRSEAIIPLSQDPSTGEGMSRIKAAREAFLHSSFSFSLWQWTGLCFNFRIKGILEIVAIRCNLAGHALASLWSQGLPIRAQSCLTLVGFERTKLLPFCSVFRCFNAKVWWPTTGPTYFIIWWLQYLQMPLIRNTMQAGLGFDCWNMLKWYWIDLNSKHEAHIFCAGVAEMLLHEAGCEQLDNAVQDGTAHRIFSPLEVIHVELAHTCHRCGWILTINLTDPASCWMVLNQRSEMLWLTWLDRAWSEVHISELPGVASSEAKNCGEKSYWVVASFEVSTGQNRCKSSTSCHFQISIFFDSCVMCGLPILSPEVCAFSVNQHACICDNVGKAPHEGTPEFQARSCTGTLETTRFSC